MVDSKKLVESIRTNDVNSLRKMIDEGANINIRNDKGYTPLHISVYYGHIEVTKTLLECGANMHTENKNGISALTIAADKVINPAPDDSGERSLNMLALLVNYNTEKNGNNTLPIASQFEQTEDKEDIIALIDEELSQIDEIEDASENQSVPTNKKNTPPAHNGEEETTKTAKKEQR